MNFKYLIRLYLVGLILTNSLIAADVQFNTENSLSPNDYLLGSYSEESDPVFDKYRTVDLSVDLGIGSDCGQIDIRNTLRASLKNILDTKYLGSIGKDIIAASPMLTACYFSPTWCSILKSSKIQANFLAQLRLDQCSAIEKYTDSRVNDYQEERSACTQRAIKKHNGNFEKAMEECRNFADYDISSWAGDGKSIENKLIESTAKWAGFKGKEADRVVNLTKAFIGDTVVKQGNIKVDFGDRRVQLTPRTYLMEVKRRVHSELCDKLLNRLVKNGGYHSNLKRLVSDQDLKNISGTNKTIIDRQTLRSLVHLPYLKRKIACRKLSDAIAMNVYTEDMGKTLDFISSKMSTNPHLPVQRRIEVDGKRRAFKDQVELTLAFEKQHSEPLNSILAQINEQGSVFMDEAAEVGLDLEVERHHLDRVDRVFFDCGDDVNC